MKIKCKFFFSNTWCAILWPTMTKVSKKKKFSCYTIENWFQLSIRHTHTHTVQLWWLLTILLIELLVIVVVVVEDEWNRRRKKQQSVIITINQKKKIVYLAPKKKFIGNYSPWKLCSYNTARYARHTHTHTLSIIFIKQWPIIIIILDSTN